MNVERMSAEQLPDVTGEPGGSNVPAAPITLKKELSNRMDEFLKRDRFSLMIQPVVDFRTNTVKNGEVLSRLEHPEKGIIFPDEFLPVVDELGLFPRFDRCIFTKSCAWLQRTLAAANEIDCLSCNFSRKTLSEAELVPDLLRIADHYGIPHGKLALEMTEREQNIDKQQLIRNLDRLKDSGFRIILDDYGAGGTSQKDLEMYPLDIVKIDRSLLLQTETAQGKEAFRALVALLTGRGAEVVCEGIETEAQDRFAREAGCHYGQGFLYFVPIRQEQAAGIMQTRALFAENR